jgi:hypothetical protein
MKRIAVAAFAASFAGHAAWAAQGVVVVERTTTAGTTRTSQIQMTPQRIRTDLAVNGQNQTVIFDGANQVLYLVDVERKTYSELTKAEADQLGAQLAGMMAQAQQMLQGLPPEQRAQIEAMVRGRGLPMPGAAGPAKAQYRKGAPHRVGRWTCDQYEMMQSDQKVGELCTVPPQALGLTPADFAVSRQLATFLQALIPQAGDAVFQLGSVDGQGFSGVPVKRSTNVLGQETVSELESVRRQDLPDTLFAVPEGFQKQPLGAGMLGPGAGLGRQ